MNVDWGWIKQRPHFIAEGLAMNHNVTICYQRRYNRKSLQKQKQDVEKLKPLFSIPRISRYERLRVINEGLVNDQIRKLVRKNKAEVLYLTYPTQLSAVPQDFRGMVFYDCMDNHAAFYDSEWTKNRIMRLEKALIERSDRVFVSSQYLLNLMAERYGADRQKLVLLRNAYNGQIVQTSDVGRESREPFRLAYVGTISTWFDWTSILEMLRKCAGVELHLFGPVDRTQIPEMENIVYHGTVEHDQLYENIKDMDVLMMPFVVNEIIEAVDPVKLYEYINFNKNIIVGYYPEVQRFEPFVNFYSSAEELVAIVNRLRQDNEVKYSGEDRLRFLQENSWERRVMDIETVMQEQGL